jgi:hypothetical protein
MTVCIWAYTVLNGRMTIWRYLQCWAPSRYYLGIHLESLTKTVKSLHQGSLHVLADIKPSISTTKVRSITPWENRYGNGMKNKTDRRRRKRGRMGTQKPVRTVSCPHVELCILWIRSNITCWRRHVYTTTSCTLDGQGSAPIRNRE